MASKRLPLTPWERVIRAADRGTGLKLSHEDIYQLAQDGAIQLRASEDEISRREHLRGMHAGDPDPNCFYCREAYDAT